MHITRVVFEGGIEVRSDNDRWTISNVSSTTDVVYSSLRDATAGLAPLRPILVTEQRDFGGDLITLLRCDGGQSFNILVSDFINRPHIGETLFPAYHLFYLVGAVGYHCQRLAEHHAQIAAKYHEIQRIPGLQDSGDRGMFSYQTEPYYEFDSLIGAARRSYDCTRYLLWPRFGSRTGYTPRSLKKLLEVDSQLPAALREQLTNSWQNFGQMLTHYRDCIHHYVPVDFGLASAYMSRHQVGAWTTMLRIPDNPEVRSKRRFTFELNRDALTYGWELSNEILAISTAVVNAVAPRQQ